MCPRQTQFTRQTFFSFHTTLWGVARAGKHTNTLWPSSMWPAVSNKLNPRPKKTAEVGGAVQKFSKAGRWKGHSVCKWCRGAVAKEMEKHKTNIRRDRVGINRDQAIVERLNRTLAERLFGHQYAFEIRLLEGLLWSPPWTAKWLAWLAKNLLKPPKKRPFIQKPATSYHRPVGVNEKRLPSAAVGAISTNPMSLKAKGKCTISKNPSPNPMSRFCIICIMATNGASFARNFLLCLPTPSCHSTYSISYSSACHASSLMWYSSGSVWIPSLSIHRLS